MKIYYLEMTDAGKLRPSPHVVGGFGIEQAQIPYDALNRFFYQVVGAAWNWRVRLPWTDAEWQAYAERRGMETRISYVQGTPAGFFELDRQEGRQTQIAMCSGCCRRSSGEAWAGPS